MISPDLKLLFEEKFSTHINEIEAVSGGDIHRACKMEASNGNQYFVKYNSSPNASQMLFTEARSLEIIRNSAEVPVPLVVSCGSLNELAYLVLPFIETGQATNEDWEIFATRLGKMHLSGESPFGLDHDNYIGTLPQLNKVTDRWVDFFREQRLIPQFQQLKTLFPSENQLLNDADVLLSKLDSIVEDAEPSLIHGDLWGGNYLIAKTGEIYIIDPCVSTSSREMDIAMSQLFGGFPKIFYQAYNHYYPLLADWEDRILLYQLYYLLAHVNMFGRSYIPGVHRAIRNYL